MRGRCPAGSAPAKQPHQRRIHLENVKAAPSPFSRDCPTRYWDFRPLGTLSPPEPTLRAAEHAGLHMEMSGNSTQNLITLQKLGLAGKLWQHAKFYY